MKPSETSKKSSSTSPKSPVDARRSTARKIYREIKAKTADYAKIFGSGSVIGSACPEFGEDCRQCTHKRWVIIFRPTNAGVDILRVLDGSRDYQRLFGV